MKGNNKKDIERLKKERGLTEDQFNELIEIMGGEESFMEYLNANKRQYNLENIFIAIVLACIFFIMTYSTS